MKYFLDKRKEYYILIKPCLYNKTFKFVFNFLLKNKITQ